MQNHKARLIAFGGGEFGEAEDVLAEFLEPLKDNKDARIAVITASTEEPQKAAAKYNNLFRGHGIPHVNTVDVAERENAFDRASLEKIEEADALFFTGGDQLHVTSLIGGSPPAQSYTQAISRGGFDSRNQRGCDDDVQFHNHFRRKR